MSIPISLRSLSIFTILFILASCAGVEPQEPLEPCQEKIQLLQWLESADALADANKNTTTGDIRYRSIVSHDSLHLPGISSNTELARVTSELDFVQIDGTGNVICSEEYDRLNEKAFRYAEQYNQYIAKYRLKNLL